MNEQYLFLNNKEELSPVSYSITWNACDGDGSWVGGSSGITLNFELTKGQYYQVSYNLNWGADGPGGFIVTYNEETLGSSSDFLNGGVEDLYNFTKTYTFTNGNYVTISNIRKDDGSNNCSFVVRFYSV